MKKIDVIDEKFKIPGEINYPITIKYPFHTERHTFDGRLVTIQTWYLKKRVMPDNQLIINGEVYRLNHIDTAKCLGRFLNRIELN